MGQDRPSTPYSSPARRMKPNKAIARARQSFHDSLFGPGFVRLGVGVTAFNKRFGVWTARSQTLA